MIKSIRGNLKLMTTHRSLALLVVATTLPFLAIAGSAQEEVDSKSFGSQDRAESSVDQAKKTIADQYSKASLKDLSRVKLRGLLEDIEKLSPADRRLVRLEQTRREQENDRPVDMESLNKSESFGSVLRSEDEDEESTKKEMPTLEEIPVSPPNSDAYRTGRGTVATSDPREAKNKDRSTPPSTIPTYSRPGSRSNDN